MENALRKSALRLRLPLLLALAGLGLSACGKGTADDVPTLHVGSQRGGTKAVMLASGALEGANYRIEWSEFAAAQPLLEAIGAGAVDVGVAGDAPFIFAYQSGSPVKAVSAQYAVERPRGALSLLVPPGSTAKTLRDLKGRKVATTRGSIGHYLILRALQQEGLPADWLTITFLTPGDARAAFVSGAIDGWATWTPYVKPAIDAGARSIVDGKDLVRGYGFDVANEKAIGAKRAILADFLQREAKALDWAKRNKDAFGRVLAQETGLPLDVATDYADKNGRTVVAIDDQLVADQQKVIDGFRAAGAIKGDRPLTGAFDRSFAPAAAGAAQDRATP